MKVVLQDGIMDCGVCSLLSVIRYYGGDVSKEYLREITNTTKNGVSAYDLIEGAKKIGFTAIGMMGDLSKIEENNLPCLAHLVVNKSYKHFVVIYKIDQKLKKVIVMDPAKGKKVFSFSEFKMLTTNNYIFLKPLKRLPILVKHQIVKKTIVEFIKREKKICIILIIVTLSYFIFNIMSAFHFKYLLELSIYSLVSNNIYLISYYLLVIYFFKSFSNYLKNVLLMKWLSVFDLKLTFKTFEQILLLPYLYYKNRTTGEVITKLKDLTIVKNFLAKLFCTLTTDLVSVSIFLLLMFRINIQLSCCAVVFILFFLLFFLFRRKKKRKLFLSVCKAEEQVNSYLIESLSNIDTIKGGHIEKSLIDRFLLKYERLLEKNYIYSLFMGINQLIKDNINDILLVLLYGIGSFFVISNKMKLGELLIYQSFFSYFLNSSNKLIELIDEYHNYRVALNRVEDLFTISAEKFLGCYYYFAYDLKGDIDICNLNYRLGSKQIFNELNLNVKLGEKILLTGESGSGKSSLVKLLMRYLDVPFGIVSISKIDINHYHLENLRSNITYVSSNEFLFTDTLYNNITLHKEIAEEDFLKIVKITKVDEIAEKSIEGFQMKVEENGFNFSNGERQRIILARALLRNSNIYIFDEALGQIDLDREFVILKEIFELFKDKIIIVISHRLNNSELFNRILKLKDGKICEIKEI